MKAEEHDGRSADDAAPSVFEEPIITHQHLTGQIHSGRVPLEDHTKDCGWMIGWCQPTTMKISTMATLQIR